MDTRKSSLIDLAPGTLNTGVEGLLEAAYSPVGSVYAIPSRSSFATAPNAFYVHRSLPPVLKPTSNGLSAQENLRSAGWS